MRHAGKESPERNGGGRQKAGFHLDIKIENKLLLHEYTIKDKPERRHW
jgi:hypothetical protein